jgi:hypothetical protein
VTVLAVSSKDVAPGTLGFLVVAGMGLVLFFLFRSMSKQLRRVDDQARSEQQAAAAASELGDAAGVGQVGRGGAAGATGAYGRADHAGLDQSLEGKTRP